MKIIYSPEYLDYKFGEGHPFWPERAKEFLGLLNKRDFKYSLVDAPKATDQDILLVHSKEYLKKLKEMVKEGGGIYKCRYTGECCQFQGCLSLCRRDNKSA